jgi:cytochrome c biogenesis protein CcmG/thiol:disulfide interchange protein DsbE
MIVRHFLYLLPLVLFAVLAGYFALALRPGRDPQLLPSAMIDKPAPAIDLPPLDGAARVTSQSLTGRVVLVNFFASWCVPCRAEHPVLMHMAKDEKIALIGIDYEDKPDQARALLAQLGDPYQAVGTDAEGRLAIDFGVYGVPETYVIDKAGRIRFRQVGPIDADAMNRTILPMVKKLEGS